MDLCSCRMPAVAVKDEALRSMSSVMFFRTHATPTSPVFVSKCDSKGSTRILRLLSMIDDVHTAHSVERTSIPAEIKCYTWKGGFSTQYTVEIDHFRFGITVTWTSARKCHEEIRNPTHTKSHLV